MGKLDLHIFNRRAGLLVFVSMFVILSVSLTLLLMYSSYVSGIVSPFQVSPLPLSAYGQSDFLTDNTSTAAESNTSKDLVVNDVRANQEQYAAAYNQGVELLTQGRYQEALTAFDKAISINPNKANAYHNKGQALDQLGRYPEALASYEEALSIDPNIALTWNNRGAVLFKLGLNDDALESYDAAISLDPTNIDFQKNKEIVTDTIMNANLSSVTAIPNASDTSAAAPPPKTSTDYSSGNKTSSSTGQSFPNRFGLDETYHILLENGTRYPMRYSITGGQVVSMDIGPSMTGKLSFNISMISEYSDNEDGKFVIEIPRSILDSKDKNFIVYERGKYDLMSPNNWKELSSDSKASVIETHFSRYSNEPRVIEIVGTETSTTTTTTLPDVTNTSVISSPSQSSSTLKNTNSRSAEFSVFPLDVNGKVFNIRYNLIGGTLDNITLDELKPPDLFIRTTSVPDETEILTIQIPRELLDSKDSRSSRDKPFSTVNQESKEIETTNEYRTLEIPNLYSDAMIVGTDTSVDDVKLDSSFPLKIRDQVFDIKYNLVGGVLNNITLDESKPPALSIDINRLGETRKLIIQIPRVLLDSGSDTDRPFTSLSGNFKEIGADNISRTLEIEDIFSSFTIIGSKTSVNDTQTDSIMNTKFSKTDGIALNMSSPVFSNDASKSVDADSRISFNSSYPLLVGNRVFTINYNLSGGELTYINFNGSDKDPSLHISTKTSRMNRTLLIEIPRELLDSKAEGTQTDSHFAVPEVEGITEIASSNNSRVLSIKNPEAWYTTIYGTKSYDNTTLASTNQPISTDASEYVSWYNQGVRLLNTGSYIQALQAFDAALSINPITANTWHNVGLAFDKLGRFDDALIAYDKALAIDPNIALTWSNKCAALYQLLRQDEALVACDKALELEPDNVNFQQNREIVMHEGEADILMREVEQLFESGVVK